MPSAKIYSIDDNEHFVQLSPAFGPQPSEPYGEPTDAVGGQGNSVSSGRAVSPVRANLREPQSEQRPMLSTADKSVEYPAPLESFDWEDRVTERLRKDSLRATVFGIAISLGITFLLVYVLPAAWRWMR